MTKQCVICGKDVLGRPPRSKTCTAACGFRLKKQTYDNRNRRVYSVTKMKGSSPAAWRELEFAKKPRTKGMCRCCGKPTSSGNHAECSASFSRVMGSTKLAGDKTISSLRKTRNKKAAENYKAGKLPKWMFS